MDRVTPDRDSEERRDHLVVFREFLDHLERTVRRSASSSARNGRPRANSN